MEAPLELSLHELLAHMRAVSERNAQDIAALERAHAENNNRLTDRLESCRRLECEVAEIEGKALDRRDRALDSVAESHLRRPAGEAGRGAVDLGDVLGANEREELAAVLGVLNNLHLGRRDVLDSGRRRDGLAGDEGESEGEGFVQH